MIGTNMLIGYGRTSTLDQTAGLEAQDRDLRALGCERIWTEQTSALGHRPALQEALEFAREGDVLAVMKLDRLARSVADLVHLTQVLERKQVSLRIASMGIDTATPTGRLMLNLLSSIAQFEREIMLERQREGIAKAKSLGKYKGRAPTARSKSAEVIELASTGMTRTQIAERLGIGVASVYRALSRGQEMQSAR
jgi:DNA invertase Pin-like site-specific DNA recombinase